MQINHGPYFFPEGGFTWLKSMSVEEIEPGIPFQSNWTIQMSGQLQAATPALLAVASKQLEIAVTIPGRDLYLRHSGVIVDQLVNANSSTGVRLLPGFRYPDNTPADFTTYRQVELSFGASYLINGAPEIMEFQQSLQFPQNGESVTVPKRCIKGRTIIATTCEQTEYVCIQSGYAVGLTRYPDRAVPMFGRPNAQPFGYTTPRRFGRIFRSYRTDWSYTFIRSTPFVGNLRPPLPPRF